MAIALKAIPAIPTGGLHGRKELNTVSTPVLFTFLPRTLTPLGFHGLSVGSTEAGVQKNHDGHQEVWRVNAAEGQARAPLFLFFFFFFFLFGA